jgi:hypothetical protein
VTQTCHHCGTHHGVEWEPSRTAYAKPVLNWWQRLLLDGEGLGAVPDPNDPAWLCRACAKEYHEFWDEMWNDYYHAIR